jgi:hypothetical protein
MIIKSTVLAVIVFLGSLTVAAAQSGMISPSSGTVNGMQLNADAIAAFVVLGPNRVHAANCLTYFDGSTTWLYVVAQENGANWFTNNVAFVAAITPACQTGNLIIFNVIDVDGEITWNWVATFAVK